MALSILSSNRVETLQSKLAQQLGALPPGNPFAPEVIVVPTFAMARWLNLRIAQQQGIAANIQYPQIGEWIWTLASSVLDDTPRRDPFSREALGWQVFKALPGLLDHAAFASLRRYLDDDQSGVKRWQLAQRVAVSFDRYQAYRPQLIRDWSSGADDQWQALLWRSIITTRQQIHRVDIIDRTIDRLADNTLVLALPERIHLFTLSSLAPIFIELINAVATRTEIFFYQHNPTDQYWADLVSEKQQAKRRLQNPDHAQYLDSDNALLASWGRQGQALQDLLLELGPITAREIDDNHPPGDETVLQCLQGSLFRLEQPVTDITIDDSVSVHICHSPLRECQVLHNHLLMLLDRHPELAAEDILIMVPEISRYAAYIEAVFQYDASNKRPNLAWNISDISVSDGHPLVRTFLQLLKLPGSRFTRSEITAYLECAEIRSRFGIDEQMLEDIHRLLETARVHWGIDAAQRSSLGLPGIHENSWQQAWDRFFAGYAMANHDLWQGIAPATEVDADSGLAIGRFRYLFERLVHWRQKLGSASNAETWQQRLHQLIDEFFSPRTVAEDLLQPLRDAISELENSGSSELSPTLVSYWMERQLASIQQPGRLYSGGVTFCGMQPMRNIPFPIICVLGMHDSAFPRKEQLAEFDLMRNQWRPGDPLKGDEDRYLMLETLLCARRYLYFSYCGRSLKDNSECQPSVLLRELLDYTDSCFNHDEGGLRPSETISQIHPMQAFSARNFHPETPGYDQYWFDTSMQLIGNNSIKAISSWPQQALAEMPELDSHIDLDSLVRFFSHPIRYFFNSRLGIILPAQQTTADEETFALQGLDKWALAERLAQDYLHGNDGDPEQFTAEGLLPHGRAADNEWLAVKVEYQALLKQLDEFRDQQPQARPVDCKLENGMSLSGEVQNCYPDIGLMHFTASKSIKGRAMTSLWLSHLALCATRQLSAQENSQLFIPATTGICYGYLDPAQARMLLTNYIELFQQGLGYPLPVFPNTSYCWASQPDPETAMKKALGVWHGGSFRNAAGGECEDEFIRLALHNNMTNPLDDPMFKDCARQIYLPAIEHGLEHD